jgi:DNA polymerase (family 10)
LRAVSGVGEQLGTTLRTLITTGRLPMLDRLRGETDSVALLESVPGIGPALAGRLHCELGIDSLEDMEAAAHGNRLSDLAGIGTKKLAGIIDTLTARLGRVRREGHADELDQPSVEELLDVDREYREKSEAGQLPKITPRRFNPTAAAWLPILHTMRGERHYTALYSNTAHAHQAGRVRDWVVLCGLDERQDTVIASQFGAMSGKRIVRGREHECEEFYRAQTTMPPAAGS